MLFSEVVRFDDEALFTKPGGGGGRGIDVSVLARLNAVLPSFPFFERPGGGGGGGSCLPIDCSVYLIVVLVHLG